MRENTFDQVIESRSGRPVMNRVLWTVQALLALLFLFAGGAKLLMPIAEMTKQMPLPALFLRFIGAAEVLGAIGLILPGVLRIAQGLTSLAAAGLVIIMAGATMLTGGAAAVFPLTVGFLLAFVGYGRTLSGLQKNVVRPVDIARRRAIQH
jgi:DoxX-like family